MNRFLKILFLVFSLVTLGTTAKCIDVNFQNSSLSVNKPHITHACTISSMKGNNQQQTHFVLLFRNGVDGKGLLFRYTSSHGEITHDAFSQSQLQLNKGLVKHVLGFFNSLALQPEFLSTAAFRSPPASCL